MENSRFVVLTGHLSEYPLPDLVGILRHQRKTGRLTIEYPKSPGTFFFHNGELVDAKLNDLTGLQAVCVALAQPEAAFNFNPLIQPSQRSIAPSFDRVVSELFGCWGESALQIEVTKIDGNSERTLPPSPPPSITPQIEGRTIAENAKRSLPPAPAPSHTPLPGSQQVLGLLSAPQTFVKRRSFRFFAAAMLVTAGFSIVIAFSWILKSARASSAKTTPETTLQVRGKSIQAEVQKPTIGGDEASKPARTSERLRRQDNSVSTVKREPRSQSSSSIEPSSQAASAGSNEVTKTPADSAGTPQSVSIVMQVENGRVVKASIENHKLGMDSYEALALRIAKQRRYPSKVSGQESVKISFARPN